MSFTREKDPDEVKDWVFDWTARLVQGESLTSYTVTVGTGLTKDSDSRSGALVTVMLSGGTDGQRYPVTCRVVTSQGRTYEDAFTVTVRSK